MMHVISVLVENQFGVLSRISGLFSARGFNITSLAVGETEAFDISRMTIVLDADAMILEQVCKQLNKLVDVIKVLDLTQEGHLERELVLVRLGISSTKRAEVLELVDIFKGKILEVTHKCMTVELAGSEERIAAFLSLVSRFGIKEMVRTGRVALAKLKIERVISGGEKNDHSIL